MFDIIKQQVSLLSVIEKDLGKEGSPVSFRPIGDKNWRIDGNKEDDECPFCGHHECFRVLLEEDDPSSSMYKCFSCGVKGDVITWRSSYKKAEGGLSMKDAAKELAAEFGIAIPTGYNPIQQVFTLAADYYHNCLIDSCNKPNPLLDGLTPLRYQTEVRRHKPETLTRFKIGFSDGGLCEYLSGMGIDDEVLISSGLKHSKFDKDFLPKNCFIYPHFVGGKASHFTFKDPIKKMQYQLPSKFSLNGYMFYGQDTFLKYPTAYIVEGENDFLSMMESGECEAAIATIGTISSSQLKWLQEHSQKKRVITMFDPDDAGDLYRQKLELMRRHFERLAHVLPPDGKDIDDHLTSGKVLSEIVKANLVKVEMKPKSTDKVGAVDAIWKDIDPEFAPVVIASPVIAEVLHTTPAPAPEVVPPTISGSDIPLPDNVVGPAPSVFEDIPATSLEDRVPANFESDKDLIVIDPMGKSVVQRAGAYYKTVFEDDKPKEIRISDFTLELLNISIDETGNRYREVIVVKMDGYRSEPLKIDSETKVTPRLFKILMAKHAEGEWLGRENELDAMWRIVLSRGPNSEIRLVSQVGRLDNHKSWLFQNMMITDSGTIIKPDENGVFWTQGKSRGIKPDGITDDYNGLDNIPALHVGMTREEADVTLGRALQGFTKILKDPGPALMALGWIRSNTLSNEIFKFNGGMGMLMFWGVAGKGKSTLARWLQLFFGLKEKMASTSISQLRSPIGFMRKADYYASLPMFLDELRADEQSIHHLGTIRSWYDREGRTMADKNHTKKVLNQKIRATLMICGEDLPADPAARERCIMIRVPPSDIRDISLKNNFLEMEDLCPTFSNITYFWLLDACNTKREEVMAEIRKIDMQLVESGCSNRISKVWAAAAYFGLQMAQKYYPDYDFMKYLIDTSIQENTQQKRDNTLSTFLELLETVQARENTPLTPNLVARDVHEPNLLHLWFSAVFKEVQDADRGRSWSKNAIMRSIKEEPYFVSDERKITMGMEQTRRNVITLDLNKCPDTLKNLANFHTS